MDDWQAWVVLAIYDDEFTHQDLEIYICSMTCTEDNENIPPPPSKLIDTGFNLKNA